MPNIQLPGYTVDQKVRLIQILRKPRPSGVLHRIYDVPKNRWRLTSDNNWECQIGDNPTTLFAAHLDTVDDGNPNGKAFATNGIGRLILTSDHTCLGADDGAGIWLLLEMIDAGVPGKYMLFQNEEIGQLGAKAAAERPDDFKGIQRMVCFDRMGTQDVVTHQTGRRCCSDWFAGALANALNHADEEMNYGEGGFLYKRSDKGIVCDSAEFTHIIPECTNISVGYMNQHTHAESLDTAHLLRLRNALIEVDWEGLPTERYLEWELDVGIVPYSLPPFSEMDWAQVLGWMERTSKLDIAGALIDLDYAARNRLEERLYF